MMMLIACIILELLLVLASGLSMAMTVTSEFKRKSKFSPDTSGVDKEEYQGIGALSCAAICSKDQACLGLLMDKHNSRCVVLHGHLNKSNVVQTSSNIYLEKKGPPQNLAYKKMTYQSSASQTSWKAVDGINNTHYYLGNSCSETLVEDNPFWYVDLNETHKITHVTVLNRGDNYSERLHDVEVTVAGEEMRFKTSCGYFTGPAQPSELVTFRCPGGTEGRFVKVQIMQGTNNLLTICETEVFGPE